METMEGKEIVQLTRPQAITLDNAAEMLRKARLVKGWVEQIEAAAKHLALTTPGGVPGLTVTTRTNRVIPDTLGAWELCKTAGWKPRDFLVCCKVSVPSLEKMRLPVDLSEVLVTTETQVVNLGKGGK